MYKKIMEIKQRRLEIMKNDQKNFALVKLVQTDDFIVLTLCILPMVGKVNVKFKEEGKVSCTCQDFWFRGRKMGFNCKHILYVLQNILKLSLDFADKNKFEDYEKVKEKCMSLNGVCSLANVLPTARNTESCPICYIDFKDSEDMKVIPCPDCQNLFHVECIHAWVTDSVSDRCPFCKSEKMA